MRKKAKIILTILLCLILIAAACCYAVPQLRARVFVSLYHEQIEEALAVGHGVPADDAVLFGYMAVNSWPGEHPMTEFLLQTYGSIYFGCYYSPDDVPLAFQNAPLPLTQDGHDYWEWSADGDNHGSTSRIRDNWYFFQASF